MNVSVVLLTFLTFLLSSVLWVYFLVRGQRTARTYAFLLSLIGIIGWNASIFLLIAGIGPTDFPGRFAFSSMTLMVGGLVWFASIFPKKARFGTFISTVFLIASAVFFVIPLTPAFVDQVIVTPEGFITGNLHPVLFPLFFNYYTGGLLFIFFYLLVRTISLKGIDRLQVAQIMFGFAFFFVPMLITQMILPRFFGDFRFNNLGPAFTITMTAFLAHAIMRYRLLDIRWIISRSFGFSLLTGFVIWVVASASLLLANTVNQSAAIFIAALIIVAIYKPIANFSDRIIAKIAHKGSYDPATATKEVFDIVRKEGDLADLMAQLSTKVKGYFSADEIAFFAFDAKRSQLIEANLIGFKPALQKEAAKLYKLAARRGDAIVEAGELEWKKKYTPEKLAKSDAADLAYLHQIGVDTVIPCSVEGRLVGLLLFGDRRFDRALRSRDIEFLNLIRSGISPALENAVKFAEMKRLYEQLAEVDKVKTQFIDIVSHRFRTPLSALRWNLETVAEGSSRLRKDLREMLADAGNRANFLSSTLDVLFDMLALENNKLSLNIAQTSLKAIVDPVVKAHMNEAAEKGLHITVNVQDAKIAADEKRLRMVLEVLLANAVAYTASGSITVQAGLREDGSTVLEVTDTGIGMTKKQLERVFEKFFRAKQAKLTYADGQGIELYVAREIAKLHKGDISVESKPKKGSTFTVILPPLKMADVKKAKISKSG